MGMIRLAPNFKECLRLLNSHQVEVLSSPIHHTPAWYRFSKARVQSGSISTLVKSPRRGPVDAYVALRVLSGIRYPLDLIDRIMRRRDIMLESPVSREILEEGRPLGLDLGRKEGLALGRKEGLEQGAEEGFRERGLDVLDVRVGVVPPDVEETVRSVQGKASLESLLRRVAGIESMEAVREHLTKVRKT